MWPHLSRPKRPSSYNIPIQHELVGAGTKEPEAVGRYKLKMNLEGTKEPETVGSYQLKRNLAGD